MSGTPLCCVYRLGFCHRRWCLEMKESSAQRVLRARMVDTDQSLIRLQLHWSYPSSERRQMGRERVTRKMNRPVSFWVNHTHTHSSSLCVYLHTPPLLDCLSRFRTLWNIFSGVEGVSWGGIRGNPHVSGNPQRAPGSHWQQETPPSCYTQHSERGTHQKTCRNCHPHGKFLKFEAFFRMGNKPVAHLLDWGSETFLPALVQGVLKPITLTLYHLLCKGLTHLEVYSEVTSASGNISRTRAVCISVRGLAQTW